MNTHSSDTFAATPILTTERLLLRPFRTQDVDRLFECARNPTLGRNAGWPSHRTREESETVLREVFLDKPCVWAIELRENRLFVGSIGLIPDPKREGTDLMMIGYWLDEAHWGRRIMREAALAVLHHAFDTLHMPAVTATCYPDNDRSHALLARLGFRVEGTLHMADRTEEGQLRDVLSFILTRDDFRGAAAAMQQSVKQ